MAAWPDFCHGRYTKAEGSWMVNKSEDLVPVLFVVWISGVSQDTLSWRRISGDLPRSKRRREVDGFLSHNAYPLAGRTGQTRNSLGPPL
jgi:hypothetical protein